jgi:peptidyl-prolyl cis-trans isomerase D
MVTVSDEEIARYYNDYQDKFSVPEKVKASHILIKTEEDSTPEAIETAKQKAMDVYRKAAGGEDFAELAKQFSEGPSAATGGDLGTFEKGQMVKPFSDKAFSMKQGEIGEPVKTRFGWHVIKVDEKFEAATKSLVEATPEIKEIKAKEKAENLAFENSDVAFEDIINGAELDQAATNMGVKVLSTNFFTKVPGPPEIPAKFRNEFSEAAFKLAEKGVSDVLDFDGDYYIIQADRIKKPYVPDLKDVKDRVTESALAAARDEKALKEAETLLAELKPGKDFPEGQASETGFFKRDNTGTDIKVDRTLIGEAFKLSDANRCPETPVKGNKGYYVLRLKEKKKGDLSLLDKEKDSIREALVSEKKSSEYQSWLNLLKQNSTITENQNLL